MPRLREASSFVAPVLGHSVGRTEFVVAITLVNDFTGNFNFSYGEIRDNRFDSLTVQAGSTTTVLAACWKQRLVKAHQWGPHSHRCRQRSCELRQLVGGAVAVCWPCHSWRHSRSVECIDSWPICDDGAVLQQPQAAFRGILATDDLPSESALPNIRCPCNAIALLTIQVGIRLGVIRIITVDEYLEAS